MINMSVNEKTKVWVNGKLITMQELQEPYKTISIAGTPSNQRIIEILAEADKPLIRQDVSKKAKLTTGYTTTLLKKLVNEGLVVEFDMEGSNFKYYLLTEKGYNFLKK